MHREAGSRGREDDATARSTRSRPQAGEAPPPPPEPAEGARPCRRPEFGLLASAAAGESSSVP